MIRVRVRIRFSVWLVSCYAHVFVLLWIVIVTLPFMFITNNLVIERRFSSLVTKSHQLPRSVLYRAHRCQGQVPVQVKCPQIKYKYDSQHN